MTDRFEVTILVDATGATKAFQAVSDGARKASLDLTKMGQSGNQSLKQLGSTIDASGQAATRSAAAVGEFGHATERGARASFNFARSRMVDLLIDTGRAAGVADEQFSAFANTVDTVAHGSGGLLHGLNPTLIALGAVASAMALATQAYAEHAKIDADLIKAEQGVTVAIINNVSATQRAAAARVQFAGVDLSKPLEVAPWTAAGQAIANHGSLLDRLTGHVTSSILSTGQAAEATANFGRSMTATAAQDVPQLIDAYDRLSEAAAKYTIGGDETVKATEEIANIMEATGPAGQVMRQQLEAAIEDFQHDGDARAFAGAIDEIATSSLAAAAALGTMTEAQQQAIAQIPAMLKAAGAEQIEATRTAEQDRVSLAEDAFKSVTAVRERETAAQTKALQQSGSAQAKAAQDSGRDQIRAAEIAARGQTTAARNAADAQIAAAKDAETSQVQAAQDAADAQVEAADRAANQQMNAADRAAQAQVRSANMAAHEQTRAATLAANQQINAVERWATATTEANSARADSVVNMAQAEEDARIKAAEDTADAEIAASKRSTQRQLDDLERRTKAQQLQAGQEASRIIQEANDAAARKIRASGSDPHVVAQQAKSLAKIQGDAIDEQIRKQEDLTKKADRGAQSIQAAGDARAKAATDRLEAIKADSQKRIDGITEAARENQQAADEAVAKHVEDVKTQAAHNVAAVERSTSRATNDAERQGAHATAQLQRQLAKQTDAVREASAKHVEEVRQAAAQHTADVTEKANREADQVARQSAREVAGERTAAARNVGQIERSTARETTQLQRRSAREQEASAHELAAIRLDSASRVKAAEDAANASVDTQILKIANANDEAAQILAKQGLIEQGADGVWTISLHPADTVAANFINAAFGSDAAAIEADGTIVLKADWSEVNKSLSAARANPPSLKVDLRPSTAGPVAAPPPPVEVQYGPLTGAANGRVVRVGENGWENVILPGGSYVRPHPASDADAGGASSGVHLHFHAPVYGLADFESKVGEAALRAVGHHLPRALKERRRALGAR